MNEWKGSLSYNEIETFVGWTLARLLTAQLITQDEEKWLRSYLVN